MEQLHTIEKSKHTTYSNIVSTVCAVLACFALILIPFVSDLFGTEESKGKKPLSKPRILTVATLTVQKQEVYQTTRTFLGAVKPRRKSMIGFEVPGMLNKILVDEGQVVTQGQLLAELDVERLEAARNEAEAQLVEVNAALRLAEATLKRTTGAQKLKAVSRQQLDETASGVQQQQARRARIQAQIERIDVDIKKAKLKAPYGGIIAARISNEGVVLSAGQPVLEIRQTGSAEIHIGINRDHLDQLQPGTTVDGSLRGQTFLLDIVRVLPGRQNMTRVVEVIAVPHDDSLPLREGDLVEITIRNQVSRTGFWLPVAALTENGRGLWSCLVAEPSTSDNKADNYTHRLVRREVEILSLEGERVYVTGNISDEDNVVADGLHRVMPNQRVKVVSARRLADTNLAAMKQ